MDATEPAISEALSFRPDAAVDAALLKPLATALPAAAAAEPALPAAPLATPAAAPKPFAPPNSIQAIGANETCSERIFANGSVHPIDDRAGAIDLVLHAHRASSFAVATSRSTCRIVTLGFRFSGFR